MTRRRIVRTLESLGVRNTGNNEFTKDDRVVFILFNRVLIMSKREQDGRMTLLMVIATWNVMDIIDYRGNITVLHRRQI